MIGFLRNRANRSYILYAGGFLLFLALLGGAEAAGLSHRWLGNIFLFAVFVHYAGIGVITRTADVAEFYVAGRRVPALANGMATAGEWLSAASFLGLAGTLYVSGYQGLAFVMGWTGGYCLVALLLAPYLRRFGQFTIPDFLAARYGGHLARFIGVAATLLVSFSYVVAQIYGAGLITSRFIGIDFQMGIFIGLAGILVCSFLGGMRAVTWTQVAQYVVLFLAFMLPVVIMSYKATGLPLPQIAYGKVMDQLAAREVSLNNDPHEIAVRKAYRERADTYATMMGSLPRSLDTERERLSKRAETLKMENASAREIASAERELKNLPRDEDDALEKWAKARAENLQKAQPPQPLADPFPAADGKVSDSARRNFLALVVCLMIGTAALPHVLMRYYTTPSVAEARTSVTWGLLFIVILYLTAPAYAVFAKWQICNELVGSRLDALPAWVSSWAKMGMLKIEDVNRDGVIQLAELNLNPDMLVLATPEIAGLPYIVTGLVAAGGLAAALTTADNLLLTIANALSHDLYYKILAPRASTQRRLVIAKSLLLIVAVLAAWVASLKPDSILSMVGVAFSVAGASFFPALVCGVFWRRANKWGAVAGMLSGFSVTLYYLVLTHPFFGGDQSAAWFDIEPVAAGIFGIPAGFAALVLGSLITPRPSAEVLELVARVRNPALDQEMTRRNEK